MQDVKLAASLAVGSWLEYFAGNRASKARIAAVTAYLEREFHAPEIAKVARIVTESLDFFPKISEVRKLCDHLRSAEIAARRRRNLEAERTADSAKGRDLCPLCDGCGRIRTGAPVRQDSYPPVWRWGLCPCRDSEQAARLFSRDCERVWAACCADPDLMQELSEGWRDWHDRMSLGRGGEPVQFGGDIVRFEDLSELQSKAVYSVLVRRDWWPDFDSPAEDAGPDESEIPF